MQLTDTPFMVFHPLTFEDTGFFNRLVTHYVSHQPDILPFSQHLHRMESVEGLIHQPYPLGIERSSLSETIARQYAGIETSAETIENIQKLQKDSTFCVVTAHQLCLFGGPLYFVIKIANTIALSRELNARYPNHHFVPVYWMGSEDHDFEEVNHIRLFGKTISWTDKQGGPVGRYRTDTLSTALDELEQVLGNTPFAADIMRMMRDAYSQPNMEMATRQLVNSLFGKYGLIIVNGDETTLKSAFVPVMKKELREGISQKLVHDQSLLLEQVGYHAQASTREINLFLLQPNGRERIIREADGGYTAGSMHFSENELFDLLQKHPESFSPNVILRPIFQQSVLPAAVFIGGGAELAYWMQVKKVFDHFNVVFPVLTARTSLMYLTENQEKRRNKLKLSIQDLFLQPDELKKRFALAHAKGHTDISSQRKTILQAFNEIQRLAESIDKTLGPSTAADAKRTDNLLEQIQQKMIRAVKHQHEQELKQIDNLLQQLFPDGSLQERKDNFLNFYSRQGPAFINLLVEAILPFRDQMVVMTESSPA